MNYYHNNISPLDNRYALKIKDVINCFSEYALIRNRFLIEIDWLIYLCTNHSKYFMPMSGVTTKKLNQFKNSFDDKSVIKIKKIEEITNHDVKAVEYFIRDYFLKDKVLKKYLHLIHFGLTSEDINSLSYAIMIKEGIDLQIKKINNFKKILNKCSNNWKNISFLSRTHGQPASPSTLGKEFKVFSLRIERELKILKKVVPMAKFSGATGNYHTFNIAINKINWPSTTKRFLRNFKISINPVTTQIEPHDWIAETLDSITRSNNIFIDMCQDCWLYISNDIFILKVEKNEVGSSTMPHKVNPIDFENAEGNFGISNSLNLFMSNKLTKSRLQRDLSDSTVLRNTGLCFGYSQLAVSSVTKGILKITPNILKINEELNNNWEVLSEAIQTVMRYEGITDAYEKLKKLSRGKKITKESYIKFVNELNISKKSKNNLLNLTPTKYIGLAKKL